MTQVHIKSLTITHPGLANVLLSPIQIADIGSGTVLKSVGLWDTGATASMITSAAAKKLGLVPRGIRRVKGVHGERTVLSYAIRLILNNTDVKFDLSVAECDELSPDGAVEILIGMDIISQGDFAVSNKNGITVMTFRIPSVQRIDFVELQKKKQPFVASMNPGRNDPCSCGSGKKFKHCCEHSAN